MTERRIPIAIIRNDGNSGLPENIQELADNLNSSNYFTVLGAYPYGLFGTLREMMGVEELLTAFYDDPDLVRDMMNYLTDFWIAIYSKSLEDAKNVLGDTANISRLFVEFQKHLYRQKAA